MLEARARWLLVVAIAASVMFVLAFGIAPFARWSARDRHKSLFSFRAGRSLAASRHTGPNAKVACPTDDTTRSALGEREPVRTSTKKG